jgi:hypothetical protein
MFKDIKPSNAYIVKSNTSFKSHIFLNFCPLITVFTTIGVPSESAQYLFELHKQPSYVQRLSS